MSHRKLWTVVVLMLGGASFAIAQPKTGETKPATGAEPKDAAHKGMHEGHEGVHPGTHEGHECPLDESDSLATWKIEKTNDGVVIHLTAKNAADVAKVQKMAEEMAAHMSGEHKEMGPHKGEAAHEEGPHKAMGPHKDKPAPAKNAASGTKPQ